MTHRKPILIIILLLIGSLILIASHNSIYEGIYDSYKNLNLEDLRKKGVAYIEADRPDSALACFTIVISRYNENMSDSDKITCSKSYNSAGYVHTLMYSDYATAYRHLLKSLEIAKSIDYAPQYPYVYINIGNIYIYFEDFHNATSYYMKAYQTALDTNQWNIAELAATNIFLALRDHVRKDDLLKLIDNYLGDGIPSGSVSDFSRELAVVTRDILLNQSSNPVLLRKVEDLIKKSPKDQRLLDNLNFIKYEILLSGDNPSEVLGNLKKMIGRDKNTYGDNAVIYKAISEVFNRMNMQDSAEKYQYKSLLVRDSLMRQQNYAAIRDMHASYDVDKFEKNIKDVEAKKRNILHIAIIVSVWAVILSITVTLLIRKNRRLNEALHALYNKNNPETCTTVKDANIFSTESLKISDEKIGAEAAPYNYNSEDIPTVECQSKEIIDNETCQQIASDILKVMNDIKTISQCEFTVRKLADMIGTKERYVSYVINEYFGKNFNSLLNEYRIAEAKRILDDKVQSNRITIEGLSQLIGFKSRSNFALVFKKETGLTPSEYRKISAHKKV